VRYAAPGLGIVGNDVVDLADPAIAGHHRRERFVSRVCAPGEHLRATTAAGLWTLFAAKEAAYKALVKLGHAPGFAHREILVAPDLDAVTWHGCRLRLRVVRDDERVHAVAWSAAGDAPPLAACARADGPLERAARALVCSLVADATGFPAAELAVVRDPAAGAWDGYGPPRMERLDRRRLDVAVDVSLSHDGRFVAAAACVGTLLGNGVLRPE